MKIFKSKKTQYKYCVISVIRYLLTGEKWHAYFILLTLLSVAAIGCKTSAEKSNSIQLNAIEVVNTLTKEEDNSGKYEAELEMFKRISHIRITRNEKILSEVENLINMQGNQLDTSVKKKVDRVKQKNRTLKEKLNEHQAWNDKFEWQNRKKQFEKEIRLVESEIQDLRNGSI